VRPAEPPQIADRRLVLEDERVANPYVSIQMLAPVREPGDQDEAAALFYLAEILGGSGQTSLMARRLQVEEQRSLYTAAFYDSTSFDPSGFTLVNLPVPGVSLEEAEADLWRVIEAFLDEGIDAAQFERIRFSVEAGEIYAEDNTAGLARGYGVDLAAGLSVADADGWADALDAVTPEDVMAAAERLFDGASTVTGYLMQPEPTQTDATEASQ